MVRTRFSASPFLISLLPNANCRYSTQECDDRNPPATHVTGRLAGLFGAFDPCGVPIPDGPTAGSCFAGASEHPQTVGGPRSWARVKPSHFLQAGIRRLRNPLR